MSQTDPVIGFGQMPLSKDQQATELNAAQTSSTNTPGCERASQSTVAAYVEQTAELLQLNIDPQYLPGTVDNFATIAAIATMVIKFNLPEKIEAAPVFKP